MEVDLEPLCDKLRRQLVPHSFWCPDKEEVEFVQHQVNVVLVYLTDNPTGGADLLGKTLEQGKEQLFEDMRSR